MRWGYARVSTRDQHPEAQTDRLWAAGCDEVLVDEGVSGSQARRPAWDKLLGLVQPGDELVTVKLDRIGRSVANLIDVTNALQDAEVELIVLDQNIDTRTTTGKLMFHMLAAIAEFERGLIIERTLDGQATVRAMGNLRRSLGGSPPLGFYDPSDEGEGRDWLVHSADAAYLADAAARVLEDEPNHRVETAHKALGRYTDQRGRVVTVKQLRAALQRPASAGIIREPDGTEIRGAAPEYPLDPDTYRKLCAVFAARRRGRPTSSDGTYALGPVLACGKCGNQLTGSTYYYRGAARRVYACANPHKIGGVVRQPCKGVSIDAGAVNELLRGAVVEWSRTPAGREAARLQPDTTGRSAELDAEEQGIHTLAALLTANVRSGVLSPADYALHTEGMSADIARITAEREQLAEVAAEPAMSTVDKWEQMTQAEKLRYVRSAVVTPISVAPGRGGARPTPPSDRVELEPRAA
jgi:DNA invertase Pin-like site-specific DNA recombinase